MKLNQHLLDTYDSADDHEPDAISVPTARRNLKVAPTVLVFRYTRFKLCPCPGVCLPTPIQPSHNHPMYPILIPRHTDKLSLPATLDTTRSLTELRTYPLAVAQPIGYALRDYHMARLALMGECPTYDQ